MTLAQVERLLRRYGGLLPEVLARSGRAAPSLGANLKQKAVYCADSCYRIAEVPPPAPAETLRGAPPYLTAEIAYAVTDEGARHLEDVLERRTRIAMETPSRGLDAAEEVAAIMAPLLGWDAATLEREVAAYRRQVGAQLAAEQAPDDNSADAMLAGVPPLLAPP